jgi:hypothetical protein
MKKKVFDVSIDGSLDQGVYAISFVDFPAIQEDFMFFNKMQFQKIDEEQRMVYGPALIPNKLILRVHPETQEEFYVRFTREVIRDIAHRYLKQGHQSDMTIMHESAVDGCTVVEAWLKESSMDKSVALGFSDMPDGTWFIGTHVEDDATWERIKAGEVRGFSVESFFGLDPVKLSLSIEEQILKELEQLLSEGA